MQNIKKLIIFIFLVDAVKEFYFLSIKNQAKPLLAFSQENLHQKKNNKLIESSNKNSNIFNNNPYLTQLLLNGEELCSNLNNMGQEMICNLCDSKKIFQITKSNWLEVGMQYSNKLAYENLLEKLNNIIPIVDSDLFYFAFSIEKICAHGQSNNNFQHVDLSSLLSIMVTQNQIDFFNEQNFTINMTDSNISSLTFQYDVMTESFSNYSIAIRSNLQIQVELIKNQKFSLQVNEIKIQENSPLYLSGTSQISNTINSPFEMFIHNSSFVELQFNSINQSHSSIIKLLNQTTSDIIKSNFQSNKYLSEGYRLQVEQIQLVGVGNNLYQFSQIQLIINENFPDFAVLTDLSFYACSNLYQFNEISFEWNITCNVRKNSLYKGVITSNAQMTQLFLFQINDKDQSDLAQLLYHFFPKTSYIDQSFDQIAISNTIITIEEEGIYKLSSNANYYGQNAKILGILKPVSNTLYYILTIDFENSFLQNAFYLRINQKVRLQLSQLPIEVVSLQLLFTNFNIDVAQRITTFISSIESLVVKKYLEINGPKILSSEIEQGTTVLYRVKQAKDLCSESSTNLLCYLLNEFEIEFNVKLNQIKQQEIYLSGNLFDENQLQSQFNKGYLQILYPTLEIEIDEQSYKSFLKGQQTIKLYQQVLKLDSIVQFNEGKQAFEFVGQSLALQQFKYDQVQIKLGRFKASSILLDDMTSKLVMLEAFAAWGDEQCFIVNKENEAQVCIFGILTGELNDEKWLNVEGVLKGGSMHNVLKIFGGFNELFIYERVTKSIKGIKFTSDLQFKSEDFNIFQNSLTISLSCKAEIIGIPAQLQLFISQNNIKGEFQYEKFEFASQNIQLFQQDSLPKMTFEIDTKQQQIINFPITIKFMGNIFETYLDLSNDELFQIPIQGSIFGSKEQFSLTIQSSFQQNIQNSKFQVEGSFAAVEELENSIKRQLTQKIEKIENNLKQLQFKCSQEQMLADKYLESMCISDFCPKKYQCKDDPQQICLEYKKIQKCEKEDDLCLSPEIVCVEEKLDCIEDEMVCNLFDDQNKQCLEEESQCVQFIKICAKYENQCGSNLIKGCTQFSFEEDQSQCLKYGIDCQLGLYPDNICKYQCEQSSQQQLEQNNRAIQCFEKSSNFENKIQGLKLLKFNLELFKIDSNQFKVELDNEFKKTNIFFEFQIYFGHLKEESKSIEFKIFVKNWDFINLETLAKESIAEMSKELSLIFQINEKWISLQDEDLQQLLQEELVNS